MNSNDLLDIVGEAKEEHVLDAVNTRNGVQPQKKRLSLNRTFLIAAVIALLLFLVGCGAYIVVRNLYWSEELQENLISYNKSSDAGNVSKNWIIDEAAIELSAEPPIDGNVTITCKEWGHNADGTLIVGSEYWIEKWNGTAYEEIPTQDRTPWIVPEQEVVCGTKSSWTVNYCEKYGELGAGQYRIGMMFSKVSPEGDVAQLGCYAKFNIQDPAYAPSLEAFIAALDDILNADAYHIIQVNYDMPYFSPISAKRIELWKSGNNYANCGIYRDRETNEWQTKGTGHMVRNGIGYLINWPDHTVSAKPTEWRRIDYIEDFFFHWSTFFDSAYQNALDVAVFDNQLNIIAPTGVKSDRYYEMRIFFTNGGEIYRMECAGIPDITYSEEERELWVTVEIVPTTSDEAEQMILGIDVSTPASFSYHDDIQHIEQQQDVSTITDNFRNDTVQSDMSSETAERLARAEVPAEFNTLRVFLDQSEEIWKVEFTYSADEEIYYAVYMNDVGVTQMIVTSRFQ